MTEKEILQTYSHLAEMVYAQFGESCNATLYSIYNGKGKVVVSKGNLLEDNSGEEMPDYIMQMYERAKDNPPVGYGFINRCHPGYLLRTSLHYIYNENHRLIGCFCISHNMMQIKMVMSFLEEFYRTENYLKEEEPFASTDTQNTIQDFVSQTIDDFINKRLSGRDFSTLPRAQKLLLIEELNQKGIFLVKGTVEIIAKKVHLSKFAIYNYLDEIRSKNDIK